MVKSVFALFVGTFGVSCSHGLKIRRGCASLLGQRAQHRLEAGSLQAPLLVAPPWDHAKPQIFRPNEQRVQLAHVVVLEHVLLSVEGVQLVLVRAGKALGGLGAHGMAGLHEAHDAAEKGAALRFALHGAFGDAGREGAGGEGLNKAHWV